MCNCRGSSLFAEKKTVPAASSTPSIPSTSKSPFVSWRSSFASAPIGFCLSKLYRYRCMFPSRQLDHRNSPLDLMNRTSTCSKSIQAPGVVSVNTIRDLPDFASAKYSSILSSVRLSTSAQITPSRTQPNRGMYDSSSLVSEIQRTLPLSASTTPSFTTGFGSPTFGYFSFSTLGCVGSQSVMGYVGTLVSSMCRNTISLLSGDQK